MPVFFSDANDFVKSLPGIPSYEDASSSKENHGRFKDMFNDEGQTRFNNPVYQAAYWGNKSDYLPNYPKHAVDPTIVLQFMMLYKSNKEEINAKGNTPLHLASARGNLEAVRIIMESKATSNKEPKNLKYFILLRLC